MRRVLILLALMSIPATAMAQTPQFTCKIHPGVTDYRLDRDSCVHDVTVSTMDLPNSRMQRAASECLASSGRKFRFQVYISEELDMHSPSGLPALSSFIRFEVTRGALRPDETEHSSSSGVGFNWGIPTHFYLSLDDGGGRVYGLNCKLAP